MKKYLLLPMMMLCCAGALFLACEKDDSDGKEKVAVKLCNQSDIDLTDVTIGGHEFGDIADDAACIDAEIVADIYEITWTHGTSEHSDYVEIEKCNTGCSFMIMIEYEVDDTVMDSVCACPI